MIRLPVFIVAKEFSYSCTLHSCCNTKTYHQNIEDAARVVNGVDIEKADNL